MYKVSLLVISYDYVEVGALKRRVVIMLLAIYCDCRYNQTDILKSNR